MSQIEVAKKLLAELDRKLEMKLMGTILDEYGAQYPLFNYPIEEIPNEENESEYEAQKHAGEMGE